MYCKNIKNKKIMQLIVLKLKLLLCTCSKEKFSKSFESKSSINSSSLSNGMFKKKLISSSLIFICAIKEI